MKIGQKTMSGIVLHTHGGPDNLQHHDRINIPIIDKNEILINIKYCGINHLDLWLRKGGTGDRLSLPRIPGSDIVGKVIDKGEHVAHLEVGDYVVVYPGRGCGKCNACISGRETLCKDFEILDFEILKNIGITIKFNKAQIKNPISQIKACLSRISYRY